MKSILAVLLLLPCLCVSPAAAQSSYVIRNAGGRASDDAIRSLVISYRLLGTQEFFVIHHTNCGMEFFTNEVMRDLLSSSLETAQLTSSSFRDVEKGLATAPVNTLNGSRSRTSGNRCLTISRASVIMRSSPSPFPFTATSTM
jgi:hypothetical protein